jgi:hypothetical protein
MKIILDVEFFFYVVKQKRGPHSEGGVSRTPIF